MVDKVLVVEDDPDIADLIRVNLSELGIHIDHTLDGQNGYELATKNEYDLLLLDVMLPNKSGMDICRDVRQQKPQQSIMMLTAKSSETDRVLGLELGADDYISKPFSVRELQARVRAQLRKVQMFKQLNQSNQSNNQNTDSLSFGDLHIDTLAHTVSLDNKHLELTATEFDLLLYLAKHPNQVFSRAQLLEAVWGYHHCGYEHTVNSHINRLRAKLEVDATAPKMVQTVWGVGYKFTPNRELV